MNKFISIHVSTEAQVKHFFHFVEKLCSQDIQVLVFLTIPDFPNLWRHDEY